VAPGTPDRWRFIYQAIIAATLLQIRNFLVAELVHLVQARSQKPGDACRCVCHQKSSAARRVLARDVPRRSCERLNRELGLSHSDLRAAHDLAQLLDALGEALTGVATRRSVCLSPRCR
jgi:hypothetical protein